MINLSKKKIALIGGAGFIGHNLALALTQKGAQVVIVDGLQVNNLLAFAATDNDNENRELYYRIINQRLDLIRKAGIQLVVQDARDYRGLSSLLVSIKPNVIIHLAAVAHAGRSNKDPSSTFDHSLRTLENTLDYAKHPGLERFVYFSSSMVYGHFKDGAVTEETLCEPLGIYGALKYSGEKIIIAYNQVFGLPYTIIRPSALYGERCVSRRVGQIFIENALRGKDISIEGDGSERLDFTYIGDLVNGIINTLESEKSMNETFNLTYGESRSVGDMIDILRKVFPNIKIKHSPKDKLMPHRGTLSVEKARRLIGYQPQYPLEKGFSDYIRWYQSIWS